MSQENALHRLSRPHRPRRRPAAEGQHRRDHFEWCVALSVRAGTGGEKISRTPRLDTTRLASLWLAPMLLFGADPELAFLLDAVVAGGLVDALSGAYSTPTFLPPLVERF